MDRHLDNQRGYGALMEFRVLGPLEVLGPGGPLRLGGRKQRMVAALLVQSVGTRVSLDDLIDGVYRDDPTSRARRTIQTYISNLRRELGDVIQRVGGGYVLALERSAVDAARFEDSYRAAMTELGEQPERATARLREALGLWRGHPYADLDPSGALEAEVVRLSELRVAALDARMEADLALGRHHELIGELEALTAEYPYGEGFRAHQMLALYRCGRQSDALRAFGRTRAVLAEELGIDPSPGLQDLERRVLIQDPSLDVVVRPRIERRAILVSDLDAETWEGSRRDAVLRRREAVLNGVSGSTGATVVGVRGTAVFVSFASVAPALEAAVALMSGQDGQTLRLAVDYGDVEAREDEVAGPPVTRAARIVAAGHPGQVLLSVEAHRALSTDDVGWTVTALGRHSVAGLDEPLALYQLGGGNLQAHFPALRTDRVPPPTPGASSVFAPGYELRTPIGEGETGTVYRAYQASIGREVAVRAIRPHLASDHDFIRRFEAEAQRIARLVHPHVVGLLDYWRDTAGAYLVHPLIHGGDLRALISTEQLSSDVALDMVERIGSAIAHAHQRGVVHGRLRAENVLVDEDGNPYVADLGVAQMCAGWLPSSSHVYAAPETLGGGSASIAADVYALGVLTFELFEGRPAPLDRPLPVGDDAVSAVVRTAVSPDPADRQASVDELVTALRAAVAGTPASPAPFTAARNPYRGLEAFQEADADDFHGREALIDELVAAVNTSRLVVVVGPSGIGKSSVVRAGLIPALRAGVLDGSERWLVADAVPGDHPFDGLETALRRVAVASPPDLAELLRSGRDGLADATRSVLPDGIELVLVIDQFEELFTGTVSEEVRRRFLDALVGAVDATPIRVVITLRADYFDRPLRYPQFAELLRGGLVPVRAPSPDELARAIRTPARGVGVGVEDELVAQILADASGQPGALPLVQHLLSELFSSRAANVLTIEAYRQAGGLSGAVGRRAEALYAGLDVEGRAIARQVLLRLVTVAEERDDTRRRVRRSELAQLGLPAVAVDGFLRSFGDHRLVTFDRDPVTRGPTVEVAHEALLREWPRLAGWIDETRDDLHTRRRVEASARDWTDAGQDPSFLLRGALLEKAEQWERDSGVALTDHERAFLSTSHHRAAADATQAQRRRRRALSLLSAALVVTMLLAGVAVRQRGEARLQAATNRVNELAAAASLVLDADPERAMLLGLEAVRIARQDAPTTLPAAHSALHGAVQASRLLWRLPLDAGAAVEPIALSPDGRTLALHGGDSPDGVTLRRFPSGERIGEVETNGAVNAVTFSSDDMLIVTYQDPALAVAEAFDVRTSESLVEYRADPPTTYDLLRVSPDGRWLAAEAPGDSSVWEVVSGRERLRLSGSVTFLPGTTRVAVADATDVVTLFDVETGEQVDELVADAAVDMAAAGADRLALLHFDNRRVSVWDVDDLEAGPVSNFPTVAAYDMRFTPDGRVAIGGNDSVLTLVDPDTEDTIELMGLSGAISAVSATPDGSTVVAYGTSGTVTAWDATPAGPAALGNFALDGMVWAVEPTSDGALVASVFEAAGRAHVVRLDPSTGTSRRVIDDLLHVSHHGVQFATDGSTAVGLDLDLRGHVYDVATGRPVFDLPSCQSPRAVNPTDSLLLVDGRMLCTPVQGTVQRFAEPPEGAVLRTEVLDTRTGETVLDLGDRIVNSGALGPAGTDAADLVALSTDWQTLEVHRLSTGDALEMDVSPELMTTVWFSPDGRWLTATTQTGHAWLVDSSALLDGSPLQEAVVWEFAAGDGVVRMLRVSDRYATAASSSGHVRVWDLATRELTVETTIAVVKPPAVVFGGAGVVYYEDGGSLLRRLDLDVDRLVEMAQARLTRGFTLAECREYRIDPCHDQP